MNKTILIILFLFYQSSLVYSLNYGQNNVSIPVICALPLQKHLAKIQKIPEGKALIDTIQQQGAIKIINKHTNLSDRFGAFWDPDERTICIALSSKITEGGVIGAILFELHNASVASKFNHLDQLAAEGRIDKESYVKSMEYLEYINSLSAAKVAEKGIQMKILPHDARLPTYRNFEEHFSEQKRSGHSSCFARNYDNLCKSSHYRCSELIYRTQ